ncbi:MAG: LysR family transcriptional regulator [Clostridia bacterium]|nr:LysR family transcriptional regulator [Clostridia bacterium]
MDFKQLETFVAVVDEGGFSSAAERLQLSQSMVTIHIRNLETELGTKLLNRTTRSMELSQDGRTFYGYARQMLRLNRDSMFALTRANQDEHTINIVATPYTSRYYLSGRLIEFRRQVPEAKFQMTVCYNSEILGKLQAGGFEFAFCSSKIMDPNFAVHRYGSDQTVVITPNEPRYRALAGQSFPVELFGKEPVITRSSNSAQQQEFLRFIKQQLPGVRLNVALAIDDTETIKDAVAGGMGISAISEVAVRQYVRDGRVIAFPLDGMIPHHLYFVCKRKYLSDTQSKFRDFILQAVDAQAAEEE